MAAEGWRDVLLLTIRETPNKKKENAFFGMWVMMRVTPDNKCFSVKVVSGESYLMNNERKYPREGLTWYDFEALRPIFIEKISPLIDPRNPPPVPLPGAVVDDTVPESPEIEQPPF